VRTKIHKDEYPIDTLSPVELRLQWRVMQNLGYKSLFDPDFRRELRNPVRKFLYYKLVSVEENEEKKFLSDTVKFASDRIGFFSDPELFRKVMQEEEKLKVENEGGGQSSELTARQNKFKELQAKRQNTKQDVEVRDFLSQS